MEANSPCCIAGFSFSLFFTARDVGASMRCGRKTKTARPLTDEITKFRCQLFESIDRNGSFLDERSAASQKQLRLETSTHFCHTGKTGASKRKHDCAGAEALRGKLHDLPRTIWKR